MGAQNKPVDYSYQLSIAEDGDGAPKCALTATWRAVVQWDPGHLRPLAGDSGENPVLPHLVGLTVYLSVVGPQAQQLHRNLLLAAREPNDSAETLTHLLRLIAQEPHRKDAAR